MRKLNRDELAKANPLLGEESRHRPLEWRVYEDYEVVDGGGAYQYFTVRTPVGSTLGQQAHSYHPLIDTPYLFLEFARIAEQRDQEEALNRWIRRYGLLGLVRNRRFSTVVLDEYPDVVWPPPHYDDRGGPGETLEAVWSEVQTANTILTEYEAALSGDRDALEQVSFPDVDPKAREEHRQSLGVSEQEWITRMRNLAFTESMILTQTKLNMFASPAIHVAGSWTEPPLTPDRFQASWDARNLLGAMYLQFYWLITSAGDLSRCKQCRRIISYAPPMPQDGNRKPRKPRSDKEFCSTQCRQNHHYLTRIKPKRLEAGGN